MDEKKCKNPGCESTDKITRGLCKRCYNAARQHVVRSKRTTWAKLEKTGKSEPRVKRSLGGWMFG